VCCSSALHLGSDTALELYVRFRYSTLVCCSSFAAVLRGVAVAWQYFAVVLWCNMPILLEVRECVVAVLCCSTVLPWHSCNKHMTILHEVRVCVVAAVCYCSVLQWCVAIATLQRVAVVCCSGVLQ